MFVKKCELCAADFCDDGAFSRCPQCENRKHPAFYFVDGYRSMVAPELIAFGFQVAGELAAGNVKKAQQMIDEKQQQVKLWNINQNSTAQQAAIDEGFLSIIENYTRTLNTTTPAGFANDEDELAALAGVDECEVLVDAILDEGWVALSKL